MSQQSYKQRAVENQGQFQLVEEKCIPKKQAALGWTLMGEWKIWTHSGEAGVCGSLTGDGVPLHCVYR